MKPRKIRVISDDFTIKPALDGQCVEISLAADFGASFFISGMLSIVFKTLTAPIERIKLILQTQASSRQIGPSERSAYSGFLDAIIRIPREQGLLSLWRGNNLNLCRYFPAQAINFSFYDLYYEAYQRIFEPKTSSERNLIAFLSGGSVGVTSCMILYPLSFCITRISVDVGDGMKVKREFVSFKDCARKIYKTDGYRGFYQGMLCSAGGMFLYRSIYFGAYTVSKDWYLSRGKDDFQTMPVLMSLLFAHVSGCTATVVSYPFDTISRQKMLNSGRGPNGYESSRKVFSLSWLTCTFCTHSSWLDQEVEDTPLKPAIMLAIARILSNDGVVGFYKGVFANLLATVCGSFLLVTYDVTIARYEKFIARRSSRKLEETENSDVR